MSQSHNTPKVFRKRARQFFIVTRAWDLGVIAFLMSSSMFIGLRHVPGEYNENSTTDGVQEKGNPEALFH